MKTFMFISLLCLMVLLFFNTESIFGVGEEEESDYQRALNLKESEQYDEAIQIFGKLAAQYRDNKYHLHLLDAMIEQSRILKENRNSAWKARAKEAKLKVKTLYNSHATSADYWLLYARYSALEEKDHHIQAGLKKAFYFKPGYGEAFVAKGDIYLHLAKMADPYETMGDERTLDGRTDLYVRHFKGREAKASYEAALRSADLTGERKASVYYRMGELEMQIFENKGEAIEKWKKAVSISPESKWGKLSREKLSIYQ